MTKIIIDTPQGKKEVGRYYPDSKRFFTHRKRSIHFFHNTQSWALDEKVVDFLFKEKASICVLDVEKGNKPYWFSSKDWKEQGILQDFGYGRQIFLKEEFSKGRID